MAVTIEKPYLLVVEGKDEERYFGAFAEYVKVDGIQILRADGKDRLGRFLQALVKAPGFNTVDSLGIVRDADDDPKAAFQSVCGDLRRVGLPVPSSPFWPTSMRPRVSILILPNLDDSLEKAGALEDVCLESVKGDWAMECVEAYIECLRKRGFDAKNLRRLNKAKVQAFLASREETVWHVGEAAKAQCWPWRDPILSQLKIFLENIRNG